MIKRDPVANHEQEQRINPHRSSPRSFSECVGVWKSVRGLSLQDGALLSVLFLLWTLVCELLCPAPGTGVSLKICEGNKIMKLTGLSKHFPHSNIAGLMINMFVFMSSENPSETMLR